MAVRAKYDFSDRLGNLQRETESALTDILKGADNVLGDVGNEIHKEFNALSTSKIRVALEWEQNQTVSLKEPNIRSIFLDGDVI
ncbi:MAG: hypothetical protein ABIQ30_12925, partial [Devosia sp.]